MRIEDNIIVNKTSINLPPISRIQANHKGSNIFWTKEISSTERKKVSNSH